MKRRILALFLTLNILLCCIPITVSSAAEVERSKPLAGKYISIMGDSISTYAGWSDSRPITSEECSYRYGEAYYGPAGTDHHNTELLVEDTWWHQAAQELGAEVLVSNAGNSTGVMYASYPADQQWDQYLKDMRAYKTRPYHLGTQEHQPDIIALYIGSSDMSRVPVAQFGSAEEVDHNSLITANADGSYTYAEPVTVAEAYSILLHKVTTTYPDAEVYCFTVLPSAGGYLSTCNQRLRAVYPFNAMVRSVADHYGATVVDLFDAFALDPDGDGVAQQADLDRFKTFFHEDPHPNAAGFDVITRCFVDAVLENSRHIVKVETAAGSWEAVGVSRSSADGQLIKRAGNYTTANGMVVNYESRTGAAPGSNVVFKEKYTAANRADTYRADGGSEKRVADAVPLLKVQIPLQDRDDPKTEGDDRISRALGRSAGELGRAGDQKTAAEDGVYNYTVTGVEKQGAVTIRTQTARATENILPGSHDGLRYVCSDTTATATNNMITNYTPVELPTSAEDVPKIAPGYSYVYLGSDKLSNFWAAYAYNAPDEHAFPNEEPIYSDGETSLYVRMNHSVFTRRKLVVPKLYLSDSTPEGVFPAWYESIQQFTLSDDRGHILTAYCADQQTAAVDGFCYRLLNLEEATYYSAEEAAMIRAIVKNCYWGTASGFGSMDDLRQRLRQTGTFTEEELAALTDGMAMTATQYAIWTFSNVMDEKTFTHAYYTNRAAAPSKAADDAAAALIFKVYRYLTALEPDVIREEDKTPQNTVINTENFLRAASLELTGKPAEHPKNLDTDPTNDVYTTELSFALAFTANTQNGDSLLMKITNTNGEVIATGRLAGQLQEGETQLLPDENGFYSFTGICLEEGDQDISFILDGHQNMEKTAYLLASESRDGETSQTMVCVVDGIRGVNVVMDLAFSLEVDEEQTYIQRTWRTEKFASPPTGDAGEPTLWLTMMAVSTAALTALLPARRKKRS